MSSEKENMKQPGESPKNEKQSTDTQASANQPDGASGSEPQSGLGRRNMLKALAGVPVLGLFGVQVLRKLSYDDKTNARKQIIRELGLEDLTDVVKPVAQSGGDLVRIGIIGFGVRGAQLAESLGFMPKEDFEKDMGNAASMKKARLQTQLEFGNLDVAITGICDVFDMHAEKGLEIAKHDIFTGGDIARKHGVKRYLRYQDMLADPEIDAVIVSTPDHHHAQMTIDAVNAGKHVYCEKAVVHREYEIEPLYAAVKNSNVVFQHGHQYMQTTAFQQAREIVRRGMLGDISHLETTTNRNSVTGAWIRHLDSNGNPKPGDTRSIDWKQWLGKAPDVPFSIERYYGWARFFDYDTGLYGQLFSHEYDAVNQLLNVGIPKTVAATGGQYYYTDYYGQMPDVLHTNFEFPDKGFTLTYSANLTSSKNRPRTVYGKDAFMTFGSELTLTPDGDSEKYADLLKRGLVDPSRPMIDIRPGASLDSALDAVTSASVQYYASRGLVSTNIGGKEWDPNHLHLREWIDCIRNGGTPSSDIEKAYPEAVTLAMADISYRENCRTQWNPDEKKIERI
jgi:predicted dehydrogenase